MKHEEVEVRHDKVRGCGTRKGGGLYLITKAQHLAPCGKLPIVLDRCPCCDQGIKPSRGWTWIDVDRIVNGKECSKSIADFRPGGCGSCPLSGKIGKAGLLWIGEKFYPTREKWIEEAETMGISRRIKSVPHGFEIGKTWVAVAHRKAIGPVVCDSCSGLKLAAESDEECEECKGEGVVHKSAIFHLFRPEAIEYVTKGTESEEELDKLVERGITPVRVVVDEESPEGTEEE